MSEPKDNGEPIDAVGVEHDIDSAGFCGVCQENPCRWVAEYQRAARRGMEVD